MSRRDFLKLFIFILIFLGINKGTGDLFVSWSRSKTKDGITIREFELVQDTVKVVILGDSHSKEGVMASNIDAGYNLSSSAESYIATYYKMKYYLEQGHFHPEIAVLPIDLHSFSSLGESRLYSKDPAFWDKYVSYIDFEWKANTYQALPLLMTEAKFGILGGLDVLASEIEKKSTPTLVAGYFPSEKRFSEYSMDTRIERTDLRVEYQFSDYDYMDGVMVDYFWLLLDLLNTYGVKTVLVFFPITEYYYERVSDYLPVEDHITMVKSLLTEYPSVKIFDYHDLFFGHLEYFSDADHLNVYGAEIFTQKLIEDLTAVGVQPVASMGD